MALPALIPVIMMGGRIIGRIASKRLASQLAGKLGKGQRIVNKPASQAKNVPNVTSVNQAKNLKPTTKVVGKGTKPASMQSGAPKSPPKPLRADPKNKPASAGTQTAKSKTTAAGTPTQRRIAGAGVTAASLATLIPKKESGKSQAKTKSGPSKKTTVSDAQKGGQVKKETFASAFKKARDKGVGTQFTFQGKKFSAVRDSDIPKRITGSKSERLRKFLMERKRKGK